MRREHPCSLLFAGDGPLRVEVEAAVARQGVTVVQITGFLNQQEISQAYVAADMLVLPSAWGESWGLVLNKTVELRFAGSGHGPGRGAMDLVREGENGYIVPNQSVELLSRP